MEHKIIVFSNQGIIELKLIKITPYGFEIVKTTILKSDSFKCLVGLYVCYVCSKLRSLCN